MSGYSIVTRSPSSGLIGKSASSGTGQQQGGMPSIILLSDNFNLPDGSPDVTKWAGNGAIYHNRFLINYTVGGAYSVAHFPSNCTYAFDLGSVLVPDGTFNQRDILLVRTDSTNNVYIGITYTVSGGVVTAATLYGKTLDGTSLFSVNILPYSVELAAATEFWFRQVTCKFSGTNLVVTVNGTQVANVTHAKLAPPPSRELMYLTGNPIAYHVAYDNFLVTVP